VASFRKLTVRAAQRATQTFPILGIADDMVGAGFVPSLAVRAATRQVSAFLRVTWTANGRKSLSSWSQIWPRSPNRHTNTPQQLEALQNAARSRAVELTIHSVGQPEDIAPAINLAKAQGAKALNVLASPFLHDNVRTIKERTAALYLPAIYQWPEIAEIGGLVAYGPRFSEIFRQWARQLAKVFAGIKPADLPVEQPTRFELAVNLKTAKALGLEPPISLLARTDEVIK
jgi:putative ABC transport system substrate-binding protein